MKQWNYSWLIATASDLKRVGEKVLNRERLSFDDGVIMFEKASLSFAGALANRVRERLHGDKTYFNRNFHIEPTNVCVFSCSFCSYSSLYAHKEEGWELSIDDMLNIVKKYDGQPVTEVHIVGGVHPKMNLQFFVSLLQKIKAAPSRAAYQRIYPCRAGLHVSQGQS